MKLEKMVLNNDFCNGGFLIDKTKIESRAWVNDQTIIIDNVNDGAEELQKKLNESSAKIRDVYEMKEFLEKIGFENPEVTAADDFPEISEKIAFDVYEQEFFNLADSMTISVYEWLDGNNWKTVIIDDNTDTISIVISDQYVDLDEWDGRNMVTGGIGEHQRIYKILEIDGEDVRNKNMFLLNKWSQWEGTHETGEILENLDDVKKHLNNIGRDVNKYIEEIEKLEK